MQFSHSIKVIVAVVSALGLGACAHSGSSAHTNKSAQQTQGTQVKHRAMGIEQLQRMARRGDADAQYSLGYRYYYGIGVRQDMQASSNWLKQAASQGQPQARQALTLIRQADRMDNQRSRVSASEKARGTTPYAAASSSSSTTQAASISAKAAGAGGFTLQLMGTHDKQSLVDFIMANNLQDKATYYRRSFDGQDWYVLVSGRYATQSEALEAIGQLPQTVRSMNPWVKPLGLVKKEMQS
jgi:septal ring-binding cell division protein DamX